MQWRYFINQETWAGPVEILCKDDGTPQYESDRDAYDESWESFPDIDEARNAMPSLLWVLSGVNPPMVYSRPTALRLHTNGARIFLTEAEAQAEFDATPWRWAVAEYNATRVHEGYEGESYATEAEARANVPAHLYALSRFSQYSEPVLILPSVERNSANVYGASPEECIAQLPELFSWDDGLGWTRAREPGVSGYRKARALIRALADGNARYRVFPGAGMLGTLQGISDLYHRMYRADEDLTRVGLLHRLGRIVDECPISVCIQCEDSFCNDESPSVDDESYCDECYSETFRSCDGCNEVSPRDDLQSDDDGNWYHSHCIPEPEEAEDGELLEHTARVDRRRPMFLKHDSERKADLFLGWELECYPAEGKRRSLVIDRVNEVFGSHCILKRDGSLGDNGIEIVSIAATLKWHQEHARRFLENVKGELSGWKHKETGIHVHIGLAETTPLQRARCATFIGDESNKQFLDHIAGRDANTYAARYAKRLGKCHTDGETRYGALNFETANHATMEYRIFRSNVAPLGFLKNLEFCHALTTWARYAGNLEVASAQSGIVQSMSPRAQRGAPEPWRGFVKWLSNNRADYRNLYRWMQENGYAEGLRAVPVSVAA